MERAVESGCYSGGEALFRGLMVIAICWVAPKICSAVEIFANSLMPSDEVNPTKTQTAIC